jgi:VanZ family protein
MTAEGSVSEQALRTAVLWMLALTVLFMIYASLYPFEFDFSRFATLERRDWMRSLSWRRPARTDLIANLLFYLPFGALVTVLTPQRWGVLLRGLFVLGCGLLLSLLIEAAQFATRMRDPSITDVIMNGSSAGLAATLALCARGLGLRPSLPELRAPRPDAVALLLVALWLAFHAVPFMPSPRFVFVFRAPLRMIDVHWSSAAFAGFFAGYLLLAAAMRHLLRPKSFWPVFLVCAAGSILSRLLFRNHQLQINECAGLLLALPLVWRMRNAGVQDACRSAAFWATPAFVFFMLAPFAFSAAAPSFEWLQVPKLAAWNDAEPGLFELAFFYIGAVWVLNEAGLPLARVTLTMLVFALFVEVAQAWQVSKGAQLAAPVAVLLGGALIGLRNWLGATFPVTTTAPGSSPPRRARP